MRHIAHEKTYKMCATNIYMPQWYTMKLLPYCTNTSIFVDEHVRWKHSSHNKFAPYEWIDSHYICLDTSFFSMSSMIYELVHFLSKFVMIYLDSLFIHHNHIAHHQLHDNIIILSTNCHVHALDKTSHYDIILHNGSILNFVCTTNEFPPMNALDVFLYHFDKLDAPCHTQSYRMNSCLIDGHLVCANHCISKCPLCSLFLHVYLFGNILEYFDRTMTYSSSNYKSIHAYRLHGDAVYDPRVDLSQGGGDDAEHPTVISMYTLTSSQAPSGPSMRAHACAIGHKVNSLLFELDMNISLDLCTTSPWNLVHH
jgi:hypothetical protein